MKFTIIKFEGTDIERGCCGDPDRILSEGSCEIEQFDELDEAARAWANCQWSSADTLLLINGKQHGDDSFQNLQYADYSAEDDKWSDEEREMLVKFDTLVAQIFEERAARERKLREAREAEALANAIKAKALADERLRQGKLEQFRKLKNELGL
jgi:hypothetical protein